MNRTNAVFYSDLKLPLIARGKVRDIYCIDDAHWLIIASDRLSAFDVILPTPIPHKGEILTAVANFWFDRTKPLIRNHRCDIALSLEDILTEAMILDTTERERIASRATLVKRVKPLPVEAIVRGYLGGSGWRDYQRSGAICGYSLPAGLRYGERLQEPLFTPSTKAAVGEHDVNISFAELASTIGHELAAKVRSASLEIYRYAADYALRCGIIIADTKLEFGLDETGELILIDEILTPDSSRFWPLAEYRPGTPPPSFDKQFVRDYLEELGWDKKPPAPALPDEVVQQTLARYCEAQQRLLGGES